MYIVLFSGFHGTHRPPAPPSHGIDDNSPEANDEADIDIPDTQAVLERFMLNMFLWTFYTWTEMRCPLQLCVPQCSAQAAGVPGINCTTLTRCSHSLYIYCFGIPTIIFEYVMYMLHICHT